MSVAANLREVHRRIERACESCGRDPASVTLVAVSKTVPISQIQEAYDAGQRIFGESRLQEALPKLDALPKDIEWHFIGKLQSNKARRAAERFDVIQTLESESQLREIAKCGRVIQGLIEINAANEAQKSGISANLLAEFAQKVIQYEQVRLRGLMSIGPANRNAEDSRPFFRTMRELAASIGADWLSMGMSGDMDVAIQEGATHVRVGTAIFGERN